MLTGAGAFRAADVDNQAAHGAYPVGFVFRAQVGDHRQIGGVLALFQFAQGVHQAHDQIILTDGLADCIAQLLQQGADGFIALLLERMNLFYGVAQGCRCHLIQRGRKRHFCRVVLGAQCLCGGVLASPAGAGEGDDFHCIAPVLLSCSHTSGGMGFLPASIAPT